LTTNIFLNQFTDLNTVTDTGQYVVPDAGNAPAGASEWIYVEVMTWTYGPNFVTQRATELNPGDYNASRIWVRNLQDGSAWSAWDQVGTAAHPVGGSSGGTGLGFTPVQQGGGSGMANNKVYIGWNGSQLLAQVDGTPLGEIYTATTPPPSSGGTSGGTSSKAINFVEHKFNIRDYGADNSASADQNVAAFNAAIADMTNYGGGALVIPGGDFTVNNTININLPNGGVKIYGSDMGSRLVFNGGMQNGLVVNAASINLEGFRAVAASTPGMNGQGSLIYVRGAAQLGSLFETITIRDIGLTGSPGNDPLYFLAVQNPAFARLDGIGIVAFENESYGTKGNAGVYIFGDVDTVNGSAVGDFSVHGVNVYGIQTGFLVQGGTGANGQQTVEGASFTDCVVQGAQYGLHLRASGYQAPGHSWKGGHVNCDGAAFYLESWAQFKISDVLCYLNAASARKQGHVYISSSTEINVHNNHFFHFGTTGPDNGIGITGVAMDGNTSLCQVHDNDFIGFSAGSGTVYNAGTGGGNRAWYNGKQGSGTHIASGIVDLGGNHYI
jgi:hypothetical protein